jgi:phospholipase C
VHIVLLLVLLTGCGGGSGGGGINQNPQPAPEPAPTASLSASPASIEKGQASTLTWKTSNSTSASIAGIGSVPANGSLQVSPDSTSTYTLTANGQGGQVANTQATVTVSIPPPKSVQAALEASPSTIYNGQTAILEWHTENATTVTIGGIGSVPTSGSQRVSPTENTTYVLTATGSTGSQQSSASVTVHAPGTISHVIVIFQENRSTDNMFHDPVLIAHGADIANSGLNSEGQEIPLQPRPLIDSYDPYHYRQQFLEMYDGGKMDGADKIKVICSNGNGNGCIPPNPQFAYVEADGVAPYFQMAETYTFADRMFQSNQGPSFPAHQFIFTGTSAPTETSDLFAGDNPDTTEQHPSTGCIAVAGQTVPMVDPEGNEDIFMYPCFEHTTLTDLLDQKGVSWSYYSVGEGNIWTAPNAINHICQPSQATGGRCDGPDWANVYSNPTIILDDIAGGLLPGVSWVMPPGLSSDHPGGNDGTGPSWVSSVVNAVGNSPYWPNTAIFITWDDWGGFYDHVAPPIINSYEYGFRVPLIIVSPYAKKAYISHATHDFGSILKFVEKTFDLPSLGFADAVADDFSDCFDFDQPAPPFTTIPARLGPEFFLNDTRPEVPLDND